MYVHNNAATIHQLIDKIFILQSEIRLKYSNRTFIKNKYTLIKQSIYKNNITVSLFPSSLSYIR